MGTPSSSSTSAPPLLEVIPRFPCFNTVNPPPAKTKTDAVEILKRSSLSPPVPQTSIVGPSQSSGRKPGSTACSRKASTKAAISAGVSPFTERALRNSVLVPISSFSFNNASVAIAISLWLRLFPDSRDLVSSSII